MPRRKRTARSQVLNNRDVETLRRAIQDGYPWILHTESREYRRTGLSIPLSILLSYVTGISAGVAVFLGGEEHPTREVVTAVRAELKNDIAAAEERYKKIFTGKRHPESFFRYRSPGQEEWWPAEGKAKGASDL
jgi:hypothetical protein